MLAKAAGCVYSDTLIAFRLLEATVLGDMDEKFVLTGVDYKEAVKEKNLYEQIKTSLKKFQGRNDFVGEERGMRYDPTLVAEVAEVLLTQGWKKPGGRRRSSTDPGDGCEPNFRKNPLDKDGKPKHCFKCDSTYHMYDQCPYRKNSENEQSQNFGQKKEYGMVAADSMSDKYFQYLRPLMNR